MDLQTGQRWKQYGSRGAESILRTRVSVKVNKEEVLNFGKVWKKLESGMRKELDGRWVVERRLDSGMTSG